MSYISPPNPSSSLPSGGSRQLAKPNPRKESRQRETRGCVCFVGRASKLNQEVEVFEGFVT